MNYFISKNLEWLPFLEDELGQQFGPSCVERVENLPLVKVGGDVSKCQVGLSLNALPKSTTLPEGTIRDQALAIMDRVLQAWEQGSKVNLRVFSISSQYCIVTSGRAEILKDKLYKNLKKQGFFLRKNMNLGACHQIQIMIMPDRKIALSLVHKEEASNDYRAILSPFVGGHTTIADNKDAPSRAFKKLLEAQKVLGVNITKGQCVVDLGACPGGWTYVARQQGADVIAIDRSAVREDLLHDPKVTFLKEDAFKFKTQGPVDWVISDIICTPERILELIDHWVHTKFCQNFVFTIKFQGQEGYPILEEFKKSIDQLQGFDCLLRQLNVNKNEVTVMGTSTNQ